MWTYLLVALATAITTLVAVFRSRNGSSKRLLSSAQQHDQQQRQREIDLINDKAGATVEAVNARVDLATTKAEQAHQDRVTSIHREAREATPTDPDELAADLLCNIRR